jgi:hypothetical protein
VEQGRQPGTFLKFYAMKLARPDNYELVDVPKDILNMLLLKQKLQKEEFLLENEKKRNEVQGARIRQVRQTIAEINTSLEIKGWRKKKDPYIPESLGVLLRMKSIIAQEFGAQKCEDFEREAERMFAESSNETDFQFLTGEEAMLRNRVESLRKSMKRHEASTEKLDALREYLSKKIRDESDFSRRNLLSEIFKML